MAVQFRSTYQRLPASNLTRTSVRCKTTAETCVNFRFPPCIIVISHFINQLMHSIVRVADVKIYVIQKSKRHTLKNTPTCFGSHRIHHQGVITCIWLKLRIMVQLCLLCAWSVFGGICRIAGPVCNEITYCSSRCNEITYCSASVQLNHVLQLTLQWNHVLQFTLEWNHVYQRKCAMKSRIAAHVAIKSRIAVHTAMKSRIAAQVCNEITYCSASVQWNYVLHLTLQWNHVLQLTLQWNHVLQRQCAVK
jgi:hypothetical protein